MSSLRKHLHSITYVISIHSQKVVVTQIVLFEFRFRFQFPFHKPEEHNVLSFLQAPLFHLFVSEPISLEAFLNLDLRHEMDFLFVLKGGNFSKFPDMNPSLDIMHQLVLQGLFLVLVYP